jgi:amidase
VILGKTNMSEWANFRSTTSSSGWSGRGGQVRNPYVLDRTPCGSSSGSAVAVSANLAAASLGTETDGSILCPASSNSVVGIKPTVGLTSRSGVIPIAHSQDTIGPFGRTVADVATVLGAITGVDPTDEATWASVGKFYSDYTQFLDPNGLRGARIGVPRQVYFGYSAKTDAIVNDAIECMCQLGAEIIDPADIPTAEQISSDSELTVLLFEFKTDLNQYLSELTNTVIRTLEDIIEFNSKHAEEELQYFGQELLLKAQATTSLDDPIYLAALAENRRLSRQEGIDAVMDKYQLDALVMPTRNPSWHIDLVNGDPQGGGGSSQPAAQAGYPAINVPAGYIFGLPVGITFMGRAFSEPTLIKLAYAFEQATRARQVPQFLSAAP